MNLRSTQNVTLTVEMCLHPAQVHQVIKMCPLQVHKPRYNQPMSDAICQV